MCIIPIFHWICLPCKHSNCLLFELPKLSDQMLIHRSKRHEWTPGNRTFTTDQWSSNPCGFTDQIPCPPWIKALLLHNNPVIYICMQSISEKKRRKDCTAFSYHLKDFSGVNDCSIDRVTVPTLGGFDATSNEVVISMKQTVYSPWSALSLTSNHSNHVEDTNSHVPPTGVSLCRISDRPIFTPHRFYYKGTTRS